MKLTKPTSILYTFHLVLCTLYSVLCTYVYAQTITQDTLQARKYIKQADSLAKKAQYNTAIDAYQQASDYTPENKRVAYVACLSGIPVDHEIAALCEEKARALENCGITVDRIELDLSDGRDAFMALRGLFILQQIMLVGGSFCLIRLPTGIFKGKGIAHDRCIVDPGIGELFFDEFPPGHESRGQQIDPPAVDPHRP